MGLENLSNIQLPGLPSTVNAEIVAWATEAEFGHLTGAGDDDKVARQLRGQRHLLNSLSDILGDPDSSLSRYETIFGSETDGPGLISDYIENARVILPPQLSGEVSYADEDEETGVASYDFPTQLARLFVFETLLRNVTEPTTGNERKISGKQAGNPDYRFFIDTPKNSLARFFTTHLLNHDPALDGFEYVFSQSQADIIKTLAPWDLLCDHDRLEMAFQLLENSFYNEKNGSAE